MWKLGFGAQTTVTTVTRRDGTVDFAHPARPLSERLCTWTLATLWVLAPVLAVATLWF